MSEIRVLPVFSKSLASLSWPGVWAIVLALGWLLPNHYPPWIAFHTDAWTAWMFVLAGFPLILAFRDQIDWNWLTIVSALAVPIPVIQYEVGLLVFSGQAWISTAYLLGFLLSLLVGARWERNRPGQAMNALFFAVGLAAVISVGMQLYQWLSLSGLDTWIVGTAGNRPNANLIQPNQMATFLLWALIAVAWSVHQKAIGLPVALFVSMYLLFGLALTQSRTAMVALALITVASWYWRALWYSRRNLWIGLFLLTFFAACLLGIRPLNEAMLLDQPLGLLNRSDSFELRLSAYSLFLDALQQRPLSGYGWTTLAPVQLSIAENHVGLYGFFQQSHNVFLDLLLWVGIPVGALISIALILWLCRQVRRVKHTEDALLVLFIGVVGWHAMVELPLQYAYMLLPTGLVMGIVGVRSSETVFFRSPRSGLVIFLVAAAVLLGFITRDYFRIEADYRALRFEKTYRVPPPNSGADTLVLSHLQALIRLGRMSAKPGMSQDELNWMRDVTYAFPGLSNLYVYTAALALNEQPDEAHLMMRKMAKVMMPAEYQALGQNWITQSKRNNKLATVQWLDATAK